VIVAVEDLELDLSRVELRRSGERIRVEPQFFEVLAYLVDHRDRVVTKEGPGASRSPRRRTAPTTMMSLSCSLSPMPTTMPPDTA
jgi:hypothetical protein